MKQLNWVVGGVKITRFEQTILPYPWKSLYSNATEADFAPHMDWLQPTYVNNGAIQLSIHCLLVESLGHRILVDTTFGRKAEELPFKLAVNRSLPQELEAGGFRVDSIDTVLCTHFNSDHVGGNTTLRDGKIVPTYPRAIYLFTRPEMDYAESDPSHDPSKLLDGYVRPIAAAGVSKLVDTDYRITPEVRLVPAQGHTPGNVCVRISSQGKTAMLTGDLMHSPFQVYSPHVKAIPDWDGDMAVASRLRVLSECADSGCLVITSHFPPPTSGYIRRQNGGFRWEAGDRITRIDENTGKSTGG